jgi:FlaG/FlaF family flagellin (archaellin)
MHRKAISEIISMVLIVLLGISLVGTAYTWGMPMISKKQAMTDVDRIYSYFDSGVSSSLVRKIEFIAKNGGEDSFVSDINGLWKLHESSEATVSNNSLEFTTVSKVSNIAISNPLRGIGWVALTPGGSCPPEKGVVGFDPSYVVCAKAESVSSGFNITYRVWFRELYESTGTKGYKIKLIKDASGSLSSSSNTVKISRERVYTCVPPASECPNKMLIITEIKVLLV